MNNATYHYKVLVFSFIYMSTRNIQSPESKQSGASSDGGGRGSRRGDGLGTRRPDRSGSGNDGNDGKARLARPTINTSLDGPSSYQAGALPHRTPAEAKAAADADYRRALLGARDCDSDSSGTRRRKKERRQQARREAR